MRKKNSRGLSGRIHLGYVRVSTEDQAEKGVSLDAQRDRIAAHASAMGRQLTEIITDAGISAKSLDRDGLRGILAAVRLKRVASITVLKLDRLTRSVRDLAELLNLFHRSDVALISVSESIDTSTAAGRLIVNMLGSVAQWEREAIGERTAIALAHKRKNRVAYAPTPFAFCRQGDKLVEDPERKVAFDLMRSMRANGATLWSIANELENRGVRPLRGNRWWPSSIASILSSRIATETA
jgi:DNA invertase Pin-like site-specific DNA recombinase